jgi:hypothetical protein
VEIAGRVPRIGCRQPRVFSPSGFSGTVAFLVTNVNKLRAACVMLAAFGADTVLCDWVDAFLDSAPDCLDVRHSREGPDR